MSDTGEYQQGFYDGVSKVRAIAQGMFDADPEELGALKELLAQIDALLHEPPAV